MVRSSTRAPLERTSWMASVRRLRARVQLVRSENILKEINKLPIGCLRAGASDQFQSKASTEAWRIALRHGWQTDAPRATAGPPRSSVRAPLARMEPNRHLEPSEHRKPRHTTPQGVASLSRAARSRETLSGLVHLATPSRSNTCASRRRGVFHRKTRVRVPLGAVKEKSATETPGETSANERGDA